MARDTKRLLNFLKTKIRYATGNVTVGGCGVFSFFENVISVIINMLKQELKIWER